MFFDCIGVTEVEYIRFTHILVHFISIKRYVIFIINENRNIEKVVCK